MNDSIKKTGFHLFLNQAVIIIDKKRAEKIFIECKETQFEYNRNVNLTIETNIEF